MINPFEKELKHFQSIQYNFEQIKKASYVPMICNNNIYNITDVKLVSKKVKADFVFYSENDPKIFISHKDGKNVKHFQQLSGTSNYNENKQVMDFLNKVKKDYPNGVPKGYGTISSNILHDNGLKLKAIFGNDHLNNYGYDNVNLFVQGDISFVKIKNGYSLQSSSYFIPNENHVNQELPFDVSIMVMYRKDRNNHGLNNTRTMISPINSRKIKVYL